MSLRGNRKQSETVGNTDQETHQGGSAYLTVRTAGVRQGLKNSCTAKGVPWYLIPGTLGAGVAVSRCISSTKSARICTAEEFRSSPGVSLATFLRTRPACREGAAGGTTYGPTRIRKESPYKSSRNFFGVLSSRTGWAYPSLFLLF